VTRRPAAGEVTRRELEGGGATGPPRDQPAGPPRDQPAAAAAVEEEAWNYAECIGPWAALRAYTRGSASGNFRVGVVSPPGPPPPPPFVLSGHAASLTKY
jgi:hypothetical protein